MRIKVRNYRLKVVENALELIGDTPMFKLSFADEDTIIYAKVEYLNPSGSVKDRIAKHLIAEAERRGDLKPGYTIVEATSGNTGIAFSCAAAAKGYKMIVVMPETASIERRTIMKHYNAEVVLTPSKDFIAGAVEKAAEIAKKPKHWAPANSITTATFRHMRGRRLRRYSSRFPVGRLMPLSQA
jgi:cysteine synthase A